MDDLRGKLASWITKTDPCWMDCSGMALATAVLPPGLSGVWLSHPSRVCGQLAWARPVPVAGRAGDDLFHDGGLGVGVVLHMPPGPLGQVTLDLQVGFPVGVV